MAVSAFAGCGDKKTEEAESDYTGVLTKVRLGMPQKKVITLNNQQEMYYESDTELWCINTDTDIMEVRELVPSDSQYFYCDDSLITYCFREAPGEDDYLLTSYMEEVVCLLNKDTAKEYYDKKLTELAAKYKCYDYATTQTGVEDVDLSIKYETVMTLASFSVTASMEYTYDTVDGVDDYYCTHLSIKTEELGSKSAVVVSQRTADEEESEQ